MKKIVVILITLAMVFSLTACGKADKDTTRCDNSNNEVVVYLKWSDGEEELHPTKVSFWRDYVVELTLEDGSTITTGYANVIIIRK